jgi:hypothetical protein
MLFKNYGLFWRREDVFWGRPKVSGHLAGYLAGAKRSKPVDFREQQGVYILYDSSFAIVYVGQAGRGKNQKLFSRLKQHRTDALADRWERFSWFGIRTVLNSGSLQAEKIGAHSKISDVLDHLEAILIAAAEPKHNRQGGRFGAEVEQYLQHRDDDNIGLGEKEMIRELWSAHRDAETE